jgi:7-carboxy-7-deazaguanine synthase (Cx14CxxC type)
VGVDGPGGGKFKSAEALAAAIQQKWPANDSQGKRFVVCTGGEPLLQLDAGLIDALHARDFEIAVETNGTVAAPAGVDWLSVSPKAGAKLVQRSGDELKLVYPQPEVDPADFELLAFRHFFLQPMDGPSREANTELALRYCLDHPRWRLSLQIHKFLGIA